MGWPPRRAGAGEVERRAGGPRERGCRPGAAVRLRWIPAPPAPSPGEGGRPPPRRPGDGERLIMRGEPRDEGERERSPEGEGGEVGAKGREGWPWGAEGYEWGA